MMRNAKPRCFYVSEKNFTGSEEFQGNIYLKPQESPEGRWTCILEDVMSPYDLYENLSGFLRSLANLATSLIMGLKLNPITKYPVQRIERMRVNSTILLLQITSL